MSEPLELLEAFRAAALSVTKLYKTSTSQQSKARADGYQDCIEDLLAFLDDENIGQGSCDGQKIRKWALDRLERDGTPPALESDDEADKAEPAEPASTSPQLPIAAPTTVIQPPPPIIERDEYQMKDLEPANGVSSPPPSSAVEESEIVVPTLETFNFQNPHISLANLDLSDPQTYTPSPTRSPSTTTLRNNRAKNGRKEPRSSLGRGAGQKRKAFNLTNLSDIFGLGPLDPEAKGFFCRWSKT